MSFNLKYLVVLTIATILAAGCAPLDRKPSAATSATASTAAAAQNVKEEDPCEKKFVCAQDMDLVLTTARALAVKYGGAANVLVVYDIDNTLLTSTTQLGSDQWYVAQTRLTDGDPEKLATSMDWRCLVDAQELLYLTRPMKITHATVPKTIDALRTEGFTQWVITSRGPEVSLLTFREFRRQSLAFSAFPDEGSSVPVTGQRQRGVFFTSGGKKGQILSDALKEFGIAEKIKAIVFADDTEKHILSMQQAFPGPGIELHAYLYRAAQSAVDDFNGKPEIRAQAKKEWCALADHGKGIKFVEDNFSPAVINLTHTDDDHTTHSLSQCVIDVCKE